MENIKNEITMFRMFDVWKEQISKSYRPSAKEAPRNTKEQNTEDVTEVEETENLAELRNNAITSMKSVVDVASKWRSTGRRKSRRISIPKQKF